MNRRVAMAVLFSFLIPGLGQIYNEDFAKGMFFIVGSVAGFFFFGLGYLVLWLAAILDAYVRARMISNRQQEGKRDLEGAIPS